MAKKNKTRRSGRAQRPVTVAKRYKVKQATIDALEAAALTHGSIGRAIQIGIELLARSKRRLSLPNDGCILIGKTYKLTPRTVVLIDSLTSQYNTRGRVLSACAEMLASME